MIRCDQFIFDIFNNSGLQRFWVGPKCFGLDQTFWTLAKRQILVLKKRRLHSGHFLVSLPFWFFSQMILFMLIFFSGSFKCRTTMTAFISVSSLLMLVKFTSLKSRKLTNITKETFICIMHTLKKKKQLAFLNKNQDEYYFVHTVILEYFNLKE